MQVIAAVVSRQHSIRMVGVADSLVEIDHAIERASITNESVDRLALRLFFRREVTGKRSTFKRRQCPAEYFYAMLVSPLDHLLHPGNQIFRADGFRSWSGGARMAEIV